MDQICPPSTVFGAYHAYGGPQQIVVYEFNDYEVAKPPAVGNS
jgi:cephalosporin-C deacetylase